VAFAEGGGGVEVVLGTIETPFNSFTFFNYFNYFNSLTTDHFVRCQAPRQTASRAGILLSFIFLSACF